jgi:hypothetical protein
MNSSTLPHAATRRPSQVGSMLWGAALAALCVMLLPAAAAQAQAVDDALDQRSWTGTVQDSAAARKELSAALAEGRRECARQAEGRAACLKQVEGDHKAALQRLKGSRATTPKSDKAAKPAKTPKPG